MICSLLYLFLGWWYDIQRVLHQTINPYLFSIFCYIAFVHLQILALFYCGSFLWLDFFLHIKYFLEIINFLGFHLNYHIHLCFHIFYYCSTLICLLQLCYLHWKFCYTNVAVEREILIKIATQPDTFKPKLEGHFNSNFDEIS